MPWIPRAHGLRRDAKVICFGPDPLFTRYPFREFEGDLLMTGESCADLHHAARGAPRRDQRQDGAGVAGRRKAVAAMREEMLAKRRKLLEQVKSQSPVHPLYLAHCLNELKAKDAIVVNELGLPAAGLELTTPRSYLGSSLAGGLGFGLGGGLGAKLAAPEREVIAAVGDGSYYFGNPLAYHYVGRAEKLPTLTIIANNHAWGAVRQATRDVYPDGHAAKANTMPLVELNPAPAFEMVVGILRRPRREGRDGGAADAGARARLRGDPLGNPGARQRRDAEPDVRAGGTARPHILLSVIPGPPQAEPGIQHLLKRLPLDSGFALTRRPGMTGDAHTAAATPRKTNSLSS